MSSVFVYTATAISALCGHACLSDLGSVRQSTWFSRVPIGQVLHSNGIGFIQVVLGAHTHISGLHVMQRDQDCPPTLVPPSDGTKEPDG